MVVLLIYIEKTFRFFIFNFIYIKKEWINNTRIAQYYDSPPEDWVQMLCKAVALFLFVCFYVRGSNKLRGLDPGAGQWRYFSCLNLRDFKPKVVKSTQHSRRSPNTNARKSDQLLRLNTPMSCTRPKFTAAWAANSAPTRPYVRTAVHEARQPAYRQNTVHIYHPLRSVDSWRLTPDRQNIELRRRRATHTSRTRILS